MADVEVEKRWPQRNPVLVSIRAGNVIMTFTKEKDQIKENIDLRQNIYRSGSTEIPSGLYTKARETAYAVLNPKPLKSAPQLRLF